MIGACDEALAGLPSSTDIAEQLAAGAAIAAGVEAARRGERMTLSARVLAGERHAVEACRVQWQGVLDKVE